MNMVCQIVLLVCTAPGGTPGGHYRSKVASCLMLLLNESAAPLRASHTSAVVSQLPAYASVISLGSAMSRSAAEPIMMV